jgi:glycosyltransferase involved in cell wall biosynthesis
MTFHSSPCPVRLHLTNVVGAGASQLLQSLLPALENDPWVRIDRIDLPDRGTLAHYQTVRSSTLTRVYKRLLPNVLSRMLECLWLSAKFDGPIPLLVLGDIPLRCKSPQTVFVQQSNLLEPVEWHWSFNSIKFWVSRTIFRMNITRARAFIVQTDWMHDALIASYPTLDGKVHVVAQPVPSWLLNENLHRRARTYPEIDRLHLIYPAAHYPHKNHSLLADLESGKAYEWPVEELTLTLDPKLNPAPEVPWIRCKGFLSPFQMVEAYEKADALLFLSREESFGFPLVEAMFIGLPIICPDLPYAHTLCGDQAIYFDVGSLLSLRGAVQELNNRLKSGWWPDWSEQLLPIPKNWETVARLMLEVVCAS